MSPRAACMNKWPALFTIASVVVGSECRKPSICPVNSAGTILAAWMPRNLHPIVGRAIFFSVSR